MKTIQLALLAFSISFMACSQDIVESSLPSLVQNGLKTQFPAAEKVEWEKKGEHFEAEFDLALVEYNVLLDATGNILMYRTDIELAQLPAPILAAIKKDYADYHLDEIEKVTHPAGQVVYQVELEKTLFEKKVVYRADGTVSDIAYW